MEKEKTTYTISRKWFIICEPLRGLEPPTC